MKTIQAQQGGSNGSGPLVETGSAKDPVPRIGMLVAANQKPTSVCRDAEVIEAVTHMMMNDFSQIPVMQGHRIVIECKEEEQLRRIRSRARKEEASITLEYLASLNRAITKLLENYTRGVALHSIRSDKIDFATNVEQRIRLKRDILSTVGGASTRIAGSVVSP